MAQYWKRRKTHGKPPKFATANDLWEACCTYFEWAKNNPIEVPIIYQGSISKDIEKRARALTKQGLYVHLGIGKTTWDDYRTKYKEKYGEVVEAVELIIFEQKYTGAAVGIFQQQIIARELGLRDQAEIDHKSSDGTMSPKPTLSKEEAKELLDNLKKENSESDEVAS